MLLVGASGFEPLDLTVPNDRRGNLKLDLQDVYGKRLQEKVDILATQSSFEPRAYV